MEKDYKNFKEYLKNENEDLFNLLQKKKSAPLLIKGTLVKNCNIPYIVFNYQGEKHKAFTDLVGGKLPFGLEASDLKSVGKCVNIDGLKKMVNH